MKLRFHVTFGTGVFDKTLKDAFAICRQKNRAEWLKKKKKKKKEKEKKEKKEKKKKKREEEADMKEEKTYKEGRG
ncbi:unnamed protein product [Arctogadus glacialis]